MVLLLVVLFVLSSSSSAKAEETSLFLSGESGDFIVGPQLLFFTPADGKFVAQPNFDNGVSIFLNTPSFDHFWFLDFAAPHSQPLTVGVYENAQRFPFQDPSRPGLSVSGDGRGCNTLTGRFQVKEITYGPGSDIIAFWAIFEQHCEGAAPAAFGEIRLNASVDLTLTDPAPGLAGTANIMSVDGATPGASIVFVVETYQSQPGFTDIPACPEATVAMRQPQLAGSSVADPNGQASLERFVPGTASGKTVLLQAVEKLSCAVSNLVIHTFP